MSTLAEKDREEYIVPDWFLQLEEYRSRGIGLDDEEEAYLNRTRATLAKQFGGSNIFAYGWTERLLTRTDLRRPSARGMMCGIVHSRLLNQHEPEGWIEDSAVIALMRNGGRYGAKSLAQDRRELTDTGWLDIWDLGPTASRYTLTLPHGTIVKNFDEVEWG